MRYEFHPDAQADFIEAAAYYETEVPTGLGERFGDEVRRSIELLLNQPEMAPRIDGAVAQACVDLIPLLANLRNNIRRDTVCCSRSYASSAGLLAVQNRVTDRRS